MIARRFRQSWFVGLQLLKQSFKIRPLDVAIGRTPALEQTSQERQESALLRRSQIARRPTALDPKREFPSRHVRPPLTQSLPERANAATANLLSTLAVSTASLRRHGHPAARPRVAGNRTHQGARLKQRGLRHCTT